MKAVSATFSVKGSDFFGFFIYGNFTTLENFSAFFLLELTPFVLGGLF